MIHHPAKSIVSKFATGELLTPLASMISAHLELCSECKQQYKDLLDIEADQFKNEPVQLSDKEVNDAFSLFMNNIDSKKESLPKAENESFILNVSGENIILPHSLSFLKEQKITWKEFGNKNAIAPVITSKEGNFYLIYIGPGESVPEHSHTEIEYSYVVAGSYEDGISKYETGDFSYTDRTHRHSPHATSHDGCLVISWVEGRLNYFKGILSPLNSLLWWYLHRA